MNYPRKILSTVFITIMMIAIIAGLSLIIQLRPTVPENQTGSILSYPTPLSGDIPVPDKPGPSYPAPEEPTQEVDTSIQPPLCQFPIYTPVSAAPLTTTVYSYSPPKVVLTHEMAIDIAGWLPDSERLLITRYTAGDWRLIETFNTKTAETILLAEGKGVGGKPFWIDRIESVAYNIFMYDYREIWLSHGKPSEVEQISNDGLALSVSADGKQLLYFSPSAGQAPHTWDASSKINQSLSVNLADWRYPKYSGNNASLAKTIQWFQASWSPDNTKIVFYKNPWLFVYDMASGQICEIDLGKAEGEAISGPRWAVKAEWSPDGRFIALLTTISPPGQLYPFMDLTLLDVATGVQRSIQLPIGPSYGRQFVKDVAWSPDSSRIAALNILSREKGYAEEGLFIITLATGAIEQVPSPETLGGGTLGMQLAWSGDGSQIAVNCPTSEMGRLCITAVEISGAQP